MSEWWTYTPGDFLMFSARSYYRLVERYNAELWPLQWLALAAGLAALVVTLRSRGGTGRRVVFVLLGAAWLWVAWAFHQQRFATINRAAEYAAWAFVAEGLALLLVALAPGRPDNPRSMLRVPAAGAALVGFALLGYPLVAVAMGRPWSQAECFGLMPDPTAVATLGFLLLAGPTRPWLIAIPVAACIGSGSMLLTMGSADGGLPLLIGVLAAALGWLRQRPG